MKDALKDALLTVCKVLALLIGLIAVLGLGIWIIAEAARLALLE